MAGVLAASLSLIYQSFDLEILVEFLSLTPAPIIYFLTFTFWLRKPSKEERAEFEHEKEIERQAEEQAELEKKRSYQATASQSGSINIDEKGPTEYTEETPLLQSAIIPFSLSLSH